MFYLAQSEFDSLTTMMKPTPISIGTQVHLPITFTLLEAQKLLNMNHVDVV